MNTVNFLESIALRPSFDSELNNLVNSQSQGMQAAYAANDSALVRNLIAPGKIYANKTDVIGL